MRPEPFLGDDAELIRVLAETLDQVELIPHDRVDVAIDMAFRLRTIDDQLDLVSDSLVDHTSGFRSSDDETRTIRYEAGSIAVELDIDQSTGGIIGQLLPPGYQHVQFETTTSKSSVDVDHLGRFRIDRVDRQFRLRIGDGTDAAVTTWIFR